MSKLAGGKQKPFNFSHPCRVLNCLLGKLQVVKLDSDSVCDSYKAGLTHLE